MNCSILASCGLNLVTFTLVFSLGARLIGPVPESLPSPQSSSAHGELAKDLEQLDTFLSHRDLDLLESTVNAGSKKWRLRDHQAFVTYMSKACGLISSYGFGELSQRASLLSRYAMSVLASGDLPMTDRVLFTEFLMLDPPVMGEKDWRVLREQKARLWLETWRGAAGSVDPTFNVEDRPLINVPTPLGSGVPDGSSPDSIKDPRLRAEYESAITQNVEKARRYNDQYWLLRNLTHFREDTERYLVNAYSRPPQDAPELDGLLTRYLSDKAMRSRILEGVRKVSQ